MGRIGDNIEKYLSTDVHKNANKRIKGIKDPSDLYFNVIDNVKKLRNSSITVTKRMIGELAKKEAIRLKISKFKFSNNWFRNFKKFFFLKRARLGGESQYYDLEAADKFTNDFPKFIAGFSEEDIFNADESGLYLRGQNSYSFVLDNDVSAPKKVLKKLQFYLLVRWLARNFHFVF